MNLIGELNGLLEKHATTRLNGRVASERSATAAGESLRASFRLLVALGYKLEDPRNITHKHIKALCREWYRLKLSPKTMQGYLSHLRIFCRWIGKGNMVESIGYYLPDVPKKDLKVHTLARTSKSWAENGVDVAEKIREADALNWRFGLMLRMQVAFGLRRMEVVQMVPWKNDRGDKFSVYKTKGGRPRDVYIDSDHQRAVLDMVKAVLKKNECLGWTTRPDGTRADLAYSMKRYSNMLPQIGISRSNSIVTGHGLRAQFAENAALLVNLIPPTLGGTPGQHERDVLSLKRAQVSEALGHSRVSVTRSYYGSFGRGGVPDAPDRLKKGIEGSLAHIPTRRLYSVPAERRLDCLTLSAELMEVDVYLDLMQVQALWERHSRRHAVPWIKPADANLAALEAAAISFAQVQYKGLEVSESPP